MSLGSRWQGSSEGALRAGEAPVPVLEAGLDSLQVAPGLGVRESDRG